MATAEYMLCEASPSRNTRIIVPLGLGPQLVRHSWSHGEEL